MAKLCDGDVILYAMDGQHPALIAHRAEGKRTVFMKDDTVVQDDGRHRFDLIVRNDLPDLVRAMPAEVLLAAVGAGLALAMEADTIATGLKTFEPLHSGHKLTA
jgi:cyanophycin synthetase